VSGVVDNLLAAARRSGHIDSMDDRGLDEYGYIRREGSLDRVQAPFRPVIDSAVGRITETFARTRLHSAYLYGSIPRGTATTEVSDLDLLLVLHDEPTDADRTHVKEMEAALDDEHSQIDGVGILLSTTHVVLSDLERHDLGFFVACLCTRLLGPDLAAALPRYRPTNLLARETNGDLALALPQWHAEAAETATDINLKTLSRRVARRIVRTGFTLIMPQWGGWTSDLNKSAELFGCYYPERAKQMLIAAVTARYPSTDPRTLAIIIDDLGPWLATEYANVHGLKAQRPYSA
jgi:uncharacterized protein